jgi:hypothetical protein
VDPSGRLQLRSGQGLELVAAPEEPGGELGARGESAADAPEDALVVFGIDATALAEQRRALIDTAGRDRLSWLSHRKGASSGRTSIAT